MQQAAHELRAVLHTKKGPTARLSIMCALVLGGEGDGHIYKLLLLKSPRVLYCKFSGKEI
jgi:hypothetical protein